MGSIYKFPRRASPGPPSTASVSGSSIFDSRRTSYLPEPDNDGASTHITDDDRAASPAPSIASLNMPRPGAPPRGKRKRLSKACDSCHKSKRRCDGTSPCANCDFAGKQCVYTDANGRIVPPPRNREETEDEHHHHNRPRRHSVSVAHLMTHGQHGHYTDDKGAGPSYATSPPSPTPVPGLSIPGHHHLRPEQPPRPFATPISPPPAAGWDYHHPYPYYKRAPAGESADDRARRRYDYGAADPTGGLYLGLKIVSPRSSSGRLSGEKHALDLDPHLAQELVHLFFANQYPANLMFHRPTFMSALGRGQIPMPLLNGIFALAAPYSVQPALRTTPSWHCGERFAKAAAAELFDQHGQLALRPDLAAAQALCLLALHECVMRRPTQNDQHMCIAFQIMKDLGVPSMDDPTAVVFPSEQSSYEHWVSAECHRRTFWVLYVIELLSSAFTSRPMTFKDSQLKVRLPIDEATFELGFQKDMPPEFLHFPMPPTISATAELGHLVRVTWIYSTVMNQIMETNKKGRPPGPGDSVTVDTIAYSEQCLNQWEASLPERLRFSSDVLHVQMRSFESGGSVGGWLYGYMHALAECTVLGLHELMEVMPNREAARAHSVRQQRALDNLTFILASLGHRGRLSQWNATLLLALVRYRTTLSPQPDPHLTEWCAELEKQWGISLGELINVEFRRTWCASANGGVGAEKMSAEATPGANINQSGTDGVVGPMPRPRSPGPVYQTMIMPPSQVTLPPLQSFGLLHVGGNESTGNGGMNPLPLPTFGQQAQGPGQDRRAGAGMPRGLPWLEDELKSGQR
ncbi:Fungal specific transcription factor domain [Ceratobasidium sp. AG-Ba]|nr:Fungal specific transcription factor domain [Ceratobasidium sp. AG-Ba]